MMGGSGHSFVARRFRPRGLSAAIREFLADEGPLERRASAALASAASATGLVRHAPLVPRDVDVSFLNAGVPQETIDVVSEVLDRGSSAWHSCLSACARWLGEEQTERVRGLSHGFSVPDESAPAQSEPIRPIPFDRGLHALGFGCQPARMFEVDL